MSGYVPLFGSLTTGTLCGRWPDIGLWPIVLSLADRNGIVDVTPDYIARITGLDVAEVLACMARFMERDPHSRSAAEEGARLALIDPQTRSWGWRVVNHAQYRERARKQQWDIERTASGRDAERKRKERELSRSVPTCPDTSRLSPLSDSDSDSDSEKNPPTPLGGSPQQRTSRVRPTALQQEVIDAYHDVLPALPRVKVWNRQRAQALEARIRERCQDGKPADTAGYWRSLFEQVAASDFLCGRSTDFRADLEWLTRPENFAKVIEGRYNSLRANGESRAR